MHYRRFAAAALAAALTLTSLELTPAYAATAKGRQAAQTTTLDFSARRRHRYYGNRAAVGAFLGMFGTIAAIAAANNGYYYDDYYYGPGPYYYGGGGYYRGGGHFRGGGGGGHHHGGGGHGHHH